MVSIPPSLPSLSMPFNRYTSTGNRAAARSAFPSIMATGKLLSTTSVLGQYSRTVDDYNLWLPYTPETRCPARIPMISRILRKA